MALSVFPRDVHRSVVSTSLVRIAASFCLLTSSGCARVKPHQRERLAHPAMQGQVWPGMDAADEHVFEVREASKGATGRAGGGCGCN